MKVVYLVTYRNCIRPVWTWQHRYLWFTSMQALSISDKAIHYWDAQNIPQISTNKSICIHEASISNVSLYFVWIRLKASPSNLFWVNALFPSITSSNRWKKTQSFQSLSLQVQKNQEKKPTPHWTILVFPLQLLLYIQFRVVIN